MRGILEQLQPGRIHSAQGDTDELATVSSKGRVTIPKDVREALGIRPGTELDFQVEGEFLRMRKVDNREPLDRWRGAIGVGKSVDGFVDRLR